MQLLIHISILHIINDSQKCHKTFCRFTIHVAVAHEKGVKSTFCVK